MKTRSILILGVLMLIPSAIFAQFSPAPRSYVEFLFSPDHASYDYAAGETPVMTLRALAGGMPLDGTTVHIQSGMEMMGNDYEKDMTISGGELRFPIPSSEVPGFRSVSVSFSVGGKQYKSTLKLGFSPEEIKPTAKMPADFEAFWAKALAEAGSVDLAPEITPLPKYSTETVDVSLVKLTVGRGGRNMYGYLTVPRDGKKHPALFCPPGAGSNRISPTTFYSERGYIYFNICIHSGLNPELPDAEFAQARKVADDYTFNGIDNPDSFYYREVYAGCSRCVDFLCTLPEWDGTNVGVTGGSQGGALTVVTAALNRKVTFAASFYPALCDLPGFTAGRAGGWPKYFKDSAKENHATELNTLNYYDVVNFGRIVRCPVFLSFGYADDTCSPTSVCALRNSIKSPLEVVMTPNSAHWRYMESNDQAMAWQEDQMKATFLQQPRQR